MKDYTVENPVFSEKISIVEEEDLVSAENDTAAAKQLIQNDLVLSKRMKQCLGDAPEHGDSKDLVITFESGDEESVDGWTDVPVMQNVEDHKTIFRKISNMVKNVRYLYNLLGTTDISGCGADTVTGAIKKLSERKIPNVTRSASVTQEGQLALDAVEKNAAVPGTMAYDLAQINSNFIPISKGVVKNPDTIGGGDAWVIVYGKLCILSFYLQIKQDIPAWGGCNILTIPEKPCVYMKGTCMHQSSGLCGVIEITYNNNTVSLNVLGKGLSAGEWIWGQCAFFI